MNICFVNMPIEFYSPVSGGAIATIIMETAVELERRGHHLSVLTVIDGNPTYDVGDVVPLAVKKREQLNPLARKWSSLKNRWHRWDWPNYSCYLAEVRRKLAALSPPPDFVIFSNDLVIAQALAKVCPSARRIVWLHNECRSRHRKLPQSLAAVDLFIAVSDWIADWAEKEQAISRGKIRVITSGVDLARFSPRENWDQPVDRLKVLFLGRIDPNKGPDIVCDAVARLREEGAAIDLTVAGGLWFYQRGNEAGDPFMAALREKMAKAQAQYLGHVERDRVPELVRAHDVVCVLSRSNEPFGLVTLEAMASGCAVIASNRGGLPQACGGAALLADPDDFSAVVSFLRRLAEDGGFLLSRKSASMQRASEASWSVAVDRLEEALAETCAAAASACAP